VDRRDINSGRPIEVERMSRVAVYIVVLKAGAIMSNNVAQLHLAHQSRALSQQGRRNILSTRSTIRELNLTTDMSFALSTVLHTRTQRPPLIVNRTSLIATLGHMFRHISSNNNSSSSIGIHNSEVEIAVWAICTAQVSSRQIF
jgi:hypothetical protein